MPAGAGESTSDAIWARLTGSKRPRAPLVTRSPSAEDEGAGRCFVSSLRISSLVQPSPDLGRSFMPVNSGSCSANLSLEVYS